jgi:glycosyltransferase involved in cell wall biosynthesis
LFVGQHYPYKGYRQVLQAAPRVWRQIPAAEFAFVGQAVGRSRRHLARFRDPRIHVLGAVDLQTKTDAIAACSLLCVPSTQESFGAVYVEAWTYGKPVIGSPIPALREVVADGVDGLLVEQRPDAVADAILDLLLHPQKASAMGQAGNRKVVSQYTWEEIADRTEDSYQKAWRA